MSKKIIAMALALAITLGCAGALAENTKHERVYVVAGADGTVKSLTDSVRLENADGLDELADRTMLADIRNVGGHEPFTLDGEKLVWQADGKSITWQGTSAKAPAVVPVVTLTLDGEPATAAELKEKTGEAVLTVTYLTEGQAPALALSALPLPAEGVSGLKTENAAVLTEGDLSVLVGWAVPNADEALQLPVSFSASFHADHADLGWMMTVCSSDPLAAACREIDSRLGGNIPDLSAVTGVLTALKNGEALPETEGMLREVTGKINELNKGLQELDDGAESLKSGTEQIASGAAELNTGLAALKGNSEALNNGAEQIFAAVLENANAQIAASGLAEAGVRLPALTAENYAEVLDGAAAKLAGMKEAQEKLAALKAQLDQVNAFAAGLKDYTNGVAEASDGAAKLSLGAMMVSAGASALQETGTRQLKESLIGAEQSAAEKLLPLAENNLAGALRIWENMKARLADTGYDLRPDGMSAETAYIIRTDLQ